MKLLDCYVTDEEIWIILEYCQLGSLADIIRMTEQPFTEGEIACICSNIIQALDYIHALQKIHRDVKPGNILVNHLGQVKLTDFGIASTKSYSDSFIGSPLWMAPEQLSKTAYDYKIDIWALGVCIIEMSEGKAPFDHLHPIRAMYAIKTKPQTEFTNPDKFSPELNDFLRRCLQLDSSQRARTIELINHNFILKHKSEFPAIRKHFYTNKMKLIEDYKKKRVKLERSQRESVINLENDNVLSEISNLTMIHHSERQTVLNKEIDESSILMNENLTENLTFIEKSLIDSLTDSNLPSAARQLGNNIKNNNKLNLALAIKLLRNNCSPRTFTSDNIIQDITQTIPNTQRSNISLPHSNIAESLKKDSNRDHILINPYINLDYKKNTKEMKIIPPLNLNKTKDHEIPNYKLMVDTNQTVSFNNSESFSNSNDYTKIKNKESNFQYSSISHNGHKIIKPKLYKQINESNFVVKFGQKHMTETRFDESLDNQTTLNPISLERYSFPAHHEKNSDSTRQIIPLNSVFGHEKEMNVSTSINNSASKFSCSSGIETQKKEKGLLFKIIRENLDFCQQAAPKEQRNKSDNIDDSNISSEKLKLEEKMKNEINEVKMKYSMMMKNLEK